MIYFIVLFALLFCIYYYDYAKGKNLYSFSYWGFFVVLVIIAGLRYRIGNDSVVYENDYQNLPTLWELFKFDYSSTRYEPGFIIFASIPRAFSSDFMLLQFFEAIYINAIIFWFIQKNTDHRFFCLTIYYIVLFLYFTTEIMREALAVGLFLLAWPYFRDGKWLKYYCFAILASICHTSALALLILPLLTLPGIRSFFRFSYRGLFVGIGIFIVTMIINLKFYDYIRLIAFTQQMTERADIYSKSELGGSLLNITGMVDIFVRYILYGIIALSIYKGKLRKKHLSKLEKTRAERLEFMVMMQIYATIAGMGIFIALRYTNYFSMFEYVLLSTVFLRPIQLKKRLVRLRPLYWSIIVLPFFLLNFQFYMRPINRGKTLPYYSKYFPYKHRLDPERDPKREAAFRYYGTK